MAETVVVSDGEEPGSTAGESARGAAVAEGASAVHAEQAGQAAAAASEAAAAAAAGAAEAQGAGQAAAAAQAAAADAQAAASEVREYASKQEEFYDRMLGRMNDQDAARAAPPAPVAAEPEKPKADRAPDRKPHFLERRVGRRR